MAYWTHTLVVQDREYTAYNFTVYERGNHEVKIYKFCCVPKGFDGLVYVMFGEEHRFPDGIIPAGTHFYDYVDDNTLFFRVV